MFQQKNTIPVISTYTICYQHPLLQCMQKAGCLNNKAKNPFPEVIKNISCENKHLTNDNSKTITYQWETKTLFIKKTY